MPCKPHSSQPCPLGDIELHPTRRVPSAVRAIQAVWKRMLLAKAGLASIASFEARSSFGSCQKNLQTFEIQGVLVHALLPAWGVQ